jgi:hypothetical protein
VPVDLGWGGAKRHTVPTETLIDFAKEAALAEYNDKFGIGSILEDPIGYVPALGGAFEGKSLVDIAREFHELPDSGTRREFDTGSVRDAQEGKGRFDLIPYWPLFKLALHFENGAKKYGDNNWRKGQPLKVFLDSAGRHWAKLNDGWEDEDHAAALVWNVMAYQWTKHEIEEGRLPASLAGEEEASDEAQVGVSGLPILAPESRGDGGALPPS